ncbi:MAG TPA: hypothetical protein VHT50_21345 [Mycobacterium sp.]|nr:hypothetical protein [Mycobacterium sp.]
MTVAIMVTTFASTLGSFEWQALCGGFTPDLDDIAAERGFFGLVPEGIYVYGTFRTSNGAMHTPARRLPFGVDKGDAGVQGDQRLSMGRRLAVQTTNDSPDGQQHFDVPTMRASASGADLTVERTSEAVVYRAAGDRSMLVEVSPTKLHWNEEGTLDLRGELVGSGLHWYLPGRDLGMYYTSQIYEVSGSIYGEQVTGFVPFDPVYMVEGASLYAEKDILEGEQLCLSWYTWGTRWDDGTVEVGHTLAGHDQFGLCIATDAEGITIQTNRVDAAFEWASDEYHVARVEFDVDGEQWEFIADPHGTQPDMGAIPNPQQEGLMQRVGETRSPLHWTSWGEANIAHKPPRRRRFTTARSTHSHPRRNPHSIE